MKYVLLFFAALLLFSCNEKSEQGNSDAGAPFIQPDDPFNDLDPDKAEAGTGDSTQAQPVDKWYGLDSDDDTVIYKVDGKILLHGYVTGYFERIDRGDFLHYVVRDSNDFLHSFFINLKNQKQLDDYYEGYEPARGHPVTVKWVRGSLPVSDGGVVVTVYQATEIME